MSTANPFHKGDRVRLNESARGQFPYIGTAVGVVLHQPVKPHSVGVRFPGRSSPAYLATSFLERVDVEHPTAAASPEVAE